MPTDLAPQPHGELDPQSPLDRAVRFWENLVQDPGQRDLVRVVGEEYLSHLESAVDDCFHLAEYDNLCYLIDFDVLREYLEIESLEKLDTLALYALFNNKEGPKYALPAGTYQELLDWLRKLKFLDKAEEYVEKTTDRVGFIAQVAEALGVRHHTDIEADETIEQILEKLDKTLIALQRLFNLLSDPRFIGVVCDYDNADAKELARLIGSIDRFVFDSTRNRWRKWDGSRTKVDNRDAVNLATALKTTRSSISAKQEKRSYEGLNFLLVSNTALLLNLPEKLVNDVSDDFGPLRILWRLFGLPKSQFHSYVSPAEKVRLLKEYLPVMRPRNAVNAEILGMFDVPVVAIAKAQEWRNTFKRITEEIRMVTSLKGGSNSQLPLAVMNRRMIAQSLIQLSKEIFSPKSKLHELEFQRTNEASRTSARLRQVGETLTPMEQLREKSTAFRRFLGEFRVTVERIPGIQYKIAIDAHPKLQGIRVLSVTRFPSSEEDDDPLIEGELYSIRSGSLDKANPYYVLRWPVECAETRFIETVTKIVRHRMAGRAKPANARTALIRVNETSSVWNEGVVFYTSLDLFGRPLEALLLDPVTSLDIAHVARQIRTIRNREQRNASKRLRITPELQQFRVNTVDGDFLFDVVPAEGDTRRYCTVISAKNLGSEVAALFEQTGLMPVINQSLADTLIKGLAQFGPANNSRGDIYELPTKPNRY